MRYFSNFIFQSDKNYLVFITAIALFYLSTLLTLFNIHALNPKHPNSNNK